MVSYGSVLDSLGFFSVCSEANRCTLIASHLSAFSK